MRLGLFGGTFDPIHSGHLAAARAAADAASLQRILVVPSGNPPHKAEACQADYEHRFRMAELACRTDPRLEASRFEDPSLGEGPHYSVDTIRKVSRALEFEPPLRFVIGADAFAELHLWRDAEQVLAEVEFVVVGRAGSHSTASAPPTALGALAVACDHPASSRLVRHRVKIGGSLADLAPPAVCEYIWGQGLYRCDSPDPA